jgi:hypothetical protein
MWLVLRREGPCDVLVVMHMEVVLHVVLVVLRQRWGHRDCGTLGRRLLLLLLLWVR